MYTDFNNFFTVRTRNLWRIKGILRLPPHLYSVTALPSKTYTFFGPLCTILKCNGENSERTGVSQAHHLSRWFAVITTPNTGRTSDDVPHVS